MNEPAKSSRVSAVLGVLGFFLSLASLGWQMYVYKESATERALVKLSVRLPYNGEVALSERQGDLSAEVTNIGEHPLYVKRVFLMAPCPGVDGSESRDFERTGAPQPDVPIEPGAAAVYKGGSWDFTKHPLDVGQPQETYCITVESNRGVVAESSSLSSLNFWKSFVNEGQATKKLR
jgi:hypothetical protein